MTYPRAWTDPQPLCIAPVHVSEELQGAARDWVRFMRAGRIGVVLDYTIGHLKAALQALLRPPLEWLWVQMAGSSHLWHTTQRLR